MHTCNQMFVFYIYFSHPSFLKLLVSRSLFKIKTVELPHSLKIIVFHCVVVLQLFNQSIKSFRLLQIYCYIRCYNEYSYTSKSPHYKQICKINSLKYNYCYISILINIAKLFTEFTLLIIAYEFLYIDRVSCQYYDFHQSVSKWHLLIILYSFISEV